MSLLGPAVTAAPRVLLSVPVRVNAAMPPNGLLLMEKRSVLSAYGPLELANSEHSNFRRRAVETRVVVARRRCHRPFRAGDRADRGRCRRNRADEGCGEESSGVRIATVARPEWAEIGQLGIRGGGETVPATPGVRREISGRRTVSSCSSSYVSKASKHLTGQEEHVTIVAINAEGGTLIGKAETSQIILEEPRSS